MSIAQDIVDGFICQVCMMPLDQKMGFPSMCSECFSDDSGSSDLQNMLDEKGFEYDVKNSGHHLIVRCQNTTVDLWSSEKFIDRETKKKGKGIHNFLEKFKPYEPNYTVEGNRTIGKDYVKTESNELPWE